MVPDYPKSHDNLVRPSSLLNGYPLFPLHVFRAHHLGCISMFGPENVWTAPFSLDQNITLPGLSPLFPNVTCNTAGSVCHMTTGEAEINAACSMSVRTPHYAPVSPLLMGS